MTISITAEQPRAAALLLADGWHRLLSVATA
jgi:hypothetical protein